MRARMCWAGRLGGIGFDGVEQAKNEREHKVEKLAFGPQSFMEGGSKSST